MSEPGGSIEPRARRAHPLVAGAVGLAVLAALPVLSGLLTASDPPPAVPEAVVGGNGEGLDLGPVLHGRLVYLALDEATGERRLWTLDLASGSLVPGPEAPGLVTLTTAGAARDLLFLVSEAGDGLVASVLDPSAAVDPVRVARGELIELSTDGVALLVANVLDRPGCPGAPAYALRIVPLETGSPGRRYEGPAPCGTLLSIGLAGRTPLVSVLHRGRARVRLLVRDELRIEVGFDGLAHVAVSASGRLLLVEPGARVGGADPDAPRRPAVGPVSVWPGGGAPRPLVTGSRLVARRVLAWSSDGRAVLVVGDLDGGRGAWVVDVAAGTAEPLAAPGDATTLGPAAAAFDDEGTLFVVEDGRVVVVGGSGVYPLDLPAGAPPPSGPVAWLA
jgi:hypothetical protein